MNRVSAQLIAGLILVSGADVGAGPLEQEVHAQAFGFPLSPASVELLFPRFDDASGTRTLRSVQVDVIAAVAADVSVENESRLPAPDIATQVAGTGVVNFGTLVDDGSFSRVDITDGSVGPSDGVTGSGPDFWDFGTLSVPLVLSRETRTDLEQFIGAEPLPVGLEVAAEVAVSLTTDLTVRISDFAVTGMLMVTFGYDPVCPADLDGDGRVEFADLLLVLARWGPCDACGADVTGDGFVDFRDLTTILAAWGSCAD
ncbi:MAG: choice-of-anchor E domain-containing protein [Phycisphaerae bacterium]|nr:choice-of-anchor E domain-containing protein [Phycisphaerae bacterium]